MTRNRPIRPIRLITLIGPALALLRLGGIEAAAAPQRVTVDGKGVLRVAPAVVKRLGLKPRDGLVCVEFPPPPAPPSQRRPKETGDAHEERIVPRPPRIYVALRRSGALEVWPQKGVRTAAGDVPGRPGTTYHGTMEDGCLVLRRPSTAGAPRRP